MLTRLIENLWKALWADAVRHHEESETLAEPELAVRVPIVPNETPQEDVFIIPAQPLYWNRIGDPASGTNGRDFWRGRGRPSENL